MTRQEGRPARLPRTVLEPTGRLLGGRLRSRDEIAT